MSTSTETLLTADDLWRMPEGTTRRVLIRGELHETMPPGGIHSDIALELGMRLRMWAQQQQAGSVGVEAGFILARAPDTVRAPDVAYVSAARIPAAGIPEGFWPLAPDLAVEIVSPGESADEVRTKVADYLEAGARLVWLVYPRRREVLAHTPDGLIRTAQATDTLDDAEVLPGFACPVAALFG
jgi:Uma2 family endonuclease